MTTVNEQVAIDHGLKNEFKKICDLMKRTWKSN